MFKLIGIVLLVAIVGVLIVAAMQPDSFTVKRSITVNAPPEKVHALINDFQAWQRWSPWENKDPGMKRTMSAATSGTGASYRWDGNKEVGQGVMTISSSTPPSQVVIQLHFIKPFEAKNEVDFRLAPKGEMTEVTWDMHGPSPFINKLMGVFMNFDKMIGKDFEQGLANLKALAEK
jgi:carbon monoxide dehydrogenase subunit G